MASVDNTDFWFSLLSSVAVDCDGDYNMKMKPKVRNQQRNFSMSENTPQYATAVITMNAFIKRLARHLHKDGLTLKTARTKDASLGPFYTVDANNTVEHRGLEFDTLLSWGREAGLITADDVIA